MSFGSYTELAAEISDYLARGDLDDKIPTFVRLAEAKFNRKIRQGGNETTAVLTPVNGSVALPVDYQEWRSLADARGWPLRYVTPAVEAKDTAEWRFGGSGREFTIVGKTLLVAPVTAGPLTLGYYRGVGSLQADGTNWLLADHPDLYLYMGQCEAELYLKNDDRAASWASLAGQILQSMMDADKSARWGRAGARLSGPTP